MSRLYTNDVLNQVKLPNNSTYDINDTLALHLLGITETDVTATTPVPSQVVIGSTTIDVVPNDAVVCSVKGNAMYRYKQTSSDPATYVWENISPTAATIGNGTITVSTTGESDQTFTVNQTSNSTILIPVPIKGIQVAGTDLTPDSSTHKVNITAIPAANITAGVLADGFTTTTPTSESASTALVTKEYVDGAIAPIASALVFKGSVGDADANPTTQWSNLPSPAKAVLGWTYKVISEHSTAPICKVGDTIICAEGRIVETVQTYEWVVIPSGDEPSGTVTSITAGDGLTGGTITESGTIGLSLVSDHTTTVAAGAATSTTNRSYPVAIDSNNKLAVNVPWTDTTQIPVANITDVVATASASLISAIDNPIKTIDTAVADTSGETPKAPTGAVATDLFTVTSGVLTIKYLTATTAPSVTATTTANLVQKDVSGT